MGGEDGCDGSLGIFCVPDADDVKQKNNNHETIPSRLSLNRKQRSLLLYVICVLSTRSFEWNLESINIWTNFQFIWLGKVNIWLSVWEFQKLFLCQLNKLMLRIEKLITWLVCGHFKQIHSLHGYLGAEHNMYWIKKLLLQENKQIIKDEEFWAVQ